MVRSFLEYTFLGKKPLSSDVLRETQDRGFDEAVGAARARKAKQPTALAQPEVEEEAAEVATSELGAAEEAPPQPRVSPVTDSARNRLIILINVVLLLVCLTSFGTILYYAFRGLGEAPCTIQSTLVATLGYFGSALITFIESKP